MSLRDCVTQARKFVIPPPPPLEQNLDVNPDYVGLKAIESSSGVEPGRGILKSDKLAAKYSMSYHYFGWLGVLIFVETKFLGKTHVIPYLVWWHGCYVGSFLW